jgi:hypothetical protein
MYLGLLGHKVGKPIIPLWRWSGDAFLADDAPDCRCSTNVHKHSHATWAAFLIFDNRVRSIFWLTCSKVH